MARSPASFVGQARPGATLTDTGGKVALTIAATRGEVMAAPDSIGARIIMHRPETSEPSENRMVRRGMVGSTSESKRGQDARRGTGQSTGSMTTETNRNAYHR